MKKKRKKNMLTPRFEPMRPRRMPKNFLKRGRGQLFQPIVHWITVPMHFCLLSFFLQTVFLHPTKKKFRKMLQKTSWVESGGAFIIDLKKFQMLIIWPLIVVCTFFSRILAKNKKVHHFTFVNFFRPTMPDTYHLKS